MPYVCIVVSITIVCAVDSPRTVMELDTSIDRSHTSAILNPTSLFVEYACRVLSGLRIPRYRPRLMKHMCIMLAEHASTSQVT
jgi:hypothetical protein